MDDLITGFVLGVIYLGIWWLASHFAWFDFGALKDWAICVLLHLCGVFFLFVAALGGRMPQRRERTTTDE